jgi:hypothetical protein
MAIGSVSDDPGNMAGRAGGALMWVKSGMRHFGVMLVRL